VNLKTTITIEKMDNKININNYEEFAIDYIDGNLDEITLKHFEEFLNQNPAIKSEMEDLGDFTIEAPENTFNNKFNLKESGIGNVSYCEYLCISDIEGSITLTEKSELENIFNERPELLNEYKQFIKAKLEAGETGFSSKYELKESGIESISYLEYLFISQIERTITEKEQTELNKILAKNSKLVTEQEQFNKINLVANENIVFPNKANLKHSNVINFKTVGTVISALAAMLIIFFGVKTVFTNDSNQANQCISSSDVNFFRNIIKIQEDSVKINDLEYNYNLYNEVIVEQEIIDTISDNIENQFESFQYEEAIAFENPLEKNIDLKLSILDETVLDFPNYQQPNQDYYSEIDRTAQADKGIKTQNVVDFIVKQYNVLTENDVSMKVDIDKENKCYGIELNDKNYDFCLNDKFTSRRSF
jgi:hypothetical protein